MAPPAVAAAVAAGMAYAGAGITIFAVTYTGFAAAAIAGIGSLAMSFITQALAPKPPKPAEFSSISLDAPDRHLMVRQAITPRRLVYGWIRVSGPQTFVHSTDDNNKVHIVLTLSTHRCIQMDALLFNDEVVPLDSNGAATGKYAGKVRAFFGKGTTSGDSDFHTELTSAVGSNKWGSDHLQTNCAKIYIEMTWDADLFPGGNPPNISVIMKGKDDIADPRASSGWTNNAALCLADWVSNSFAYNWAFSDINETPLIAAANVCDEMVSKNPTQTFTANASTDLLTVTRDLPTAHSFFATTTNTLPAGMSLVTPYYWIRKSSTTGKIATSRDNALAGTAVDITGAGTGTHTIQGGVTFTVDVSTDIVTLSDATQHARTGNRIQVISSDTLPSGVSISTNYFWVSITHDTGKLATSLANARAGTIINITDTGTGTHLLFVNAEPRYTLDGTFDTDQDINGVLGKMLSAMAGTRVTAGKTMTLYAGEWRAPSESINEDDLAGGIQFQSRITRRDLFNGVKGVFSDPDQLWQPTDFPPVQGSSYVTEDQNDELWRDVDLPYTNSSSMAQRIASIDLERARRQITAFFPCKFTAFRIAAAEVIKINHAKYGWTDKTFEVAKWNFSMRDADNGPVLGVDLDLKEIDSAIYTWNPATKEAEQSPAVTTTLPDVFTVAAITDLTLTSGTDELFIRNDGTVFSRIKVSWTQHGNAFVKSGGRIEVEFKKSADSDWATAPTVDGSKTLNWILDVEDSVAYDVRVRAVNALGVKSSYTTSTNHTVIGKTTAPSNVSGFAAVLEAGGVRLTWTGVSDVDLKHYEIREGTVWSDNNHIADVKTDSYLETQITAAGTSDWMVKAVDTTGNESATEDTIQLVITAPAAPGTLDLSSGTDQLLVLGSGDIVSRIFVDWTSVTADFLDHYELQWKISSDSKYQSRLLGLDTTEIFLDSVLDGEDYDVRIRGVTSYGLNGTFATVTSHTVIGKTAPPADVSSFMIDAHPTGHILSWVGPDSELDFDGYLLRFRLGEDHDWDNAIPYGLITKSSPRWIPRLAGLGTVTLMVKAVDTTGNVSVNAAAIIVNSGDRIVANLIESFTQAPDWTGTKTNGTVVSNRLEADAVDVAMWDADSAAMWDTDAAGQVDDWPEVDLIADVDAGTAVDDSTLMWEVVTYEVMSYEWAFTPSLAQVGSNLTLDFDLSYNFEPTRFQERITIEYRLSNQPMWDGNDGVDMWDADSDTVMWFNKADNPSFVPWQGSITAENEEYTFKVTLGRGGLVSYRGTDYGPQGVMTTLTVEVDVPDIIERFNDISLSSGGSRLSLTESYNVIRNVSVTLQDDAGDAVSVKTMDKNTVTGPLLQAFNVNEVGTAATIDAVIQGY